MKEVEAMGNQIIKRLLEIYKPVFTREEDGCYSVEIPDFPGCCSWGENLEHARAMIEEAAELWVEAELASYNNRKSKQSEFVH